MWIPGLVALSAISPALGLFAGAVRVIQLCHCYDFVVPRGDEDLMGRLRDIVDDAVVGDDEVEDQVEGVFGDLFAEEPDALQDLSRRLNMPTLRSRWVVKAAALAKAKFGLVSDTPANQLMLSDFIRKAMTEHGIRPSHIVQLYPLAVALALCPSESEIQAARLQASAINLNAMYRRAGPWRPRQGANWFSSDKLQNNY
jgi:hypothetical protein